MLARNRRRSARRSGQKATKPTLATFRSRLAGIQSGTSWAMRSRLLRGGQVVTMDGVTHDVGKWDLLIAHPPCTYLSNAGARFLYPKGVLNEQRLRKGLMAKDFFLHFLWADIPKIAVENPIPSSVYCLPKYTQMIQPYQFGHPFKKKTCLWLKGLPELKPTDEIPIEQCESTKVAGNWFNHGGKDRQANRAKTFPGIAKAMAEQWG